MTHEELLELLPAYALDAMTLEEAREVGVHLQTCEGCRSDLAVLLETSSHLAGAFTQVSPPPHLRHQILTAVRAEPRVVVIPRDWAIGIAAAVAALIVVAALAVARFGQQVALLQQRIAAQEHVLAILAGPTAKTSILTGTVPAGVRFVYDPARGQGALVVTELRDPGSRSVYQLWLVAGTAPESAGVFRPSLGRPVVVPVRADFTKYQAVAISVERAPFGAPQPTETPILVGRI